MKLKFILLLFFIPLFSISQEKALNINEYISIKYLGGSDMAWREIIMFHDSNDTNICNAKNRNKNIHNKIYIYSNDSLFILIKNYILNYNKYDVGIINYRTDLPFEISIHNNNKTKSYTIKSGPKKIGGFFEDILTIAMLHGIDKKNLNYLMYSLILPK